MIGKDRDTPIFLEYFVQLVNPVQNSDRKNFFREKLFPRNLFFLFVSLQKHSDFSRVKQNKSLFEK